MNTQIASPVHVKTSRIKSVTSRHTDPRSVNGTVVNQRQIAINSAIEQWFSGNNSTVNSLGMFVDNRKFQPIPRITPNKVTENIWYDLQCTGINASMDHVRGTLAVISGRIAEERHGNLVRGLVKKPSSDKGHWMLDTFVTALTGMCKMMDPSSYAMHLCVMKHFIWLVKRTAAGLAREHDLMPILYNTKQGNGKSTCVRKLLSPLAELAGDITAETLVDERRRPELGDRLAGNWDEMGGAPKSDVENLKYSITSPTVSYRPMKTNDCVTIPRTMNFIGSSNKQISTMVYDTTGARRFYELHTADEIDWKSINSVDYDLLWTCISEDDPAPILSKLSQLREHQQELKHNDTVSEWIENEKWNGFIFKSLAMTDRDIPDYDPLKGDPAPVIRARYCHWCLINEEKPMSSGPFFGRLIQCGFTKHRSGKDPRTYKMPLPGVTPAPTPGASTPVEGLLCQ